VHIHWTHRLLAILLFLHVLAATISAFARNATPAVRRAVTVALVLIATQIGVAAALVLSSLPRELQALHLAVGAGIWFAIIVWATLARRDARALRARG
jgi:heme A synthase